MKQRKKVINSFSLLKNNRNLTKFAFALMLLLFSLFIGQIGFIFIEGFSWIEAFYMTVITLSTVGFTEVRPLSDLGRLFTSCYIIFNLGIFAYVVSVITSYLFEGELIDVFNKYMTGKEVKKLNNHIIVCGYGRNGARACAELLQNKTEFVLIESEKKTFEKFPGLAHIQYVIGDATLDDTLLEAGVQRARAIITTLPKDSDNVFITLTARELNPKIYIIARASEDSSEKKLYRAGVDKVVMPDAIGGKHMAQLLTKPQVIEFLNLLDGMGEQNLHLEDFTFNELKEDFRNKTIRELDIRRKTGATIIGYKDREKGFMFNPSAETYIRSGDAIIIIGTTKDIEQFKSFYSQ